MGDIKRAGDSNMPIVKGIPSEERRERADMLQLKICGYLEK